jgi:small subunit ribosomal protein S16
VAVRIRLLRMGKIRNPQYRIVVADARTKRDGRIIENVGIYHPKEDPSRIEVNSERVQYWLSVGAQPSDPVRAILRKTGDWQQFRGEAPPAEPLKTAAPKADRTAAYEQAAKEAAGLAEAAGKGEAATPKKSGRKGGKAKEADAAAEKKADAAEKTDAEKAAQADDKQATAPSGDAGEQS